ncbi:MarR family winged helix-turn-helix transcriptional regulator [uncultured Subdoligranulum sp.]|uniref:MarR family winged helix-turn-helix transcriptional regulator n=1 Tax=uncultured Subdoligranulum sp. TaxID=512298 RepID=UPI002639F060|nr:MarR family transcriptional regulator [uncultured Subdoligranulum sp.]
MDQSQAISELFELLWQMRKTMHSAMQQVEIRCPQGQFFMLERLHLAAVPVSALAEQTRMLPAAVSRSLRQLEDAGLAERIPDPEDHRRTLVRLTPAGEATRRAAEELLRDYMQRVIRRMGEAEFAALLDSWRRWDAVMRRELPERSGASLPTC